MATSEFWQRVTANAAHPGLAAPVAPSRPLRATLRGTARLWIAFDLATIVISAILATMLDKHIGPLTGAREFYRGTLIYGRSMGILLALLCSFAVALVVISRRLHLYNPTSLTNFLHEQRLSVQACVTAGLLLTGALYLVHAADIPRTIVLITIALVTVFLSFRRFIYRVLLYRRFEQGIGTRNILIVGTGADAHALRQHMESIRHLGYTFKGFIELPDEPNRVASPDEVVGSLDTLFQQTRKQFVDEIFFTTPCDRGIVQNVLEQARIHGVDLRVIPDMYDGVAWDSPVEYIGQFPTMPLHRGEVPELGFALKRVFDLFFSALTLVVLSPVLIALALAIKFDSPGGVFYSSERLGKKGVVFRCLKFRTMVRDADKRRGEVMHMNERDGVLFKAANDPRVTRLGRLLRKYSIDELPQFINVLRGEMSIVGPRPPLAGEVSRYDLSHLRRLDVTPGITGLWQVQGRQDPSFASYVSLDVTYIDNWSIWLDFKIILRTIGVVFSGTGT
jgi:exopolysaccharide biosynthesis polyprenyl glycosylphosphotransferase